jgi:toxin HigB-1
LSTLPNEIKLKVSAWVLAVQENGLERTRQRPSFHDEPLQGKRKGQRSIRLNRQWRLIYEEQTGLIIQVEEITPHDYRVR